jgi:hypothetical protein
MRTIALALAAAMTAATVVPLAAQPWDHQPAGPMSLHHPQSYRPGFHCGPWRPGDWGWMHEHPRGHWERRGRDWCWGWH